MGKVNKVLERKTNILILLSFFLLSLLLLAPILLVGGCKNEQAEKTKKANVIKPAEGISGTIEMKTSKAEDMPETGENGHKQNKTQESSKALTLPDYKLNFYDFEKKTDPFISLVMEKKQRKLAAPSAHKGPVGILSPLEKTDLKQLRLTAIVIMKNKRIAMVEDPTGKGYEITIGTYIGKNQGRVARISEQGIQVNEKVKDYNGKLIERTVEKKLYGHE